MEIKDLIGLTLEGARLSKSSYTLEFCGMIAGSYQELQLSTGFNLGESSKRCDSERDFSSLVWSSLEEELTGTRIDGPESNKFVEFHFSNGSKFAIWSEFPPTDNLIIISNIKTGELSLIL